MAALLTVSTAVLWKLTDTCTPKGEARRDLVSDNRVVALLDRQNDRVRGDFAHTIVSDARR